MKREEENETRGATEPLDDEEEEELEETDREEEEDCEDNEFREEGDGGEKGEEVGGEDESNEGEEAMALILSF